MMQGWGPTMKTLMTSAIFQGEDQVSPDPPYSRRYGHLRHDPLQGAVAQQKTEQMNLCSPLQRTKRQQSLLLVLRCCRCL
eukprot:6475878-Amphidinium_carterae.1